MKFRQGRHRGPPYNRSQEALQARVIERFHKDAVFGLVRSLPRGSQQLYPSLIERRKPLLAVFAKQVLPPAFARMLDYAILGIIKANPLAGVSLLDTPEKRIWNDVRATKLALIDAKPAQAGR